MSESTMLDAVKARIARLMAENTRLKAEVARLKVAAGETSPYPTIPHHNED